MCIIYFNALLFATATDFFSVDCRVGLTPGVKLWAHWVRMELRGETLKMHASDHVSLFGQSKSLCYKPFSLCIYYTMIAMTGSITAHVYQKSDNKRKPPYLIPQQCCHHRTAKVTGRILFMVVSNNKAHVFTSHFTSLSIPSSLSLSLSNKLRTTTALIISSNIIGSARGFKTTPETWQLLHSYIWVIRHAGGALAHKY